MGWEYISRAEVMVEKWMDRHQGKSGVWQKSPDMKGGSVCEFWISVVVNSGVIRMERGKGSI